jgi:hypothetical protein
MERWKAVVVARKGNGFVALASLSRAEMILANQNLEVGGGKSLAMWFPV